MLPGCGTMCRRKCINHISKDARVRANESFWSLDFSGRNLWLQKHVTPMKKNSHTTEKRTVTYNYTLPTDSIDPDVTVCKKMFSRTLGWHSDGSIRNYQQWLRNANNNDGSVTRIDTRGRHRPGHAIEYDNIRTHINSYNPTVSHYTREHAPFRRYLDSELTITGIFIYNVCTYHMGKLMHYY